MNKNNPYITLRINLVEKRSEQVDQTDSTRVSILFLQSFINTYRSGGFAVPVVTVFNQVYNGRQQTH